MARETCNKCGEKVEADDDAILIQFIYHSGRLPTRKEDFWLLFNYGSSHLMSSVKCPGNPSIAEHLKRTAEGQPIENASEKVRWRSAYKMMKKMEETVKEVGSNSATAGLREKF